MLIILNTSITIYQHIISINDNVVKLKNFLEVDLTLQLSATPFSTNVLNHDVKLCYTHDYTEKVIIC